MPLTDTKVRNAKALNKVYKLFDGHGLHILIQPNGSKWWRFKYRAFGKEKLLSLGVYPQVTLADARERCIKARKLLAARFDPSEAKKEAKRQAILKSENTFEAVAREWHSQFKHKWTPDYAASALRRLQNHIFPRLGTRPIADITPPEMLSVVRVVEKAGTLDMAQRVMQLSGQIFTYAIATGRATRNPVPDLRGALKPPVRKHMAHFKADELPDFLKTLETFSGNAQTKNAIKFLMLTFVRTGEMRGAEWVEINLAKAEWRIPAERMKMRSPHIVPLSKQAVAVLHAQRNISGNRQHVFPNQHRPMGCMSENTVLYALYDMGYRFKATGHGFRATASTILNEHGFSPDVIERQLAHCPRDQVRASYNHAQYLPERRRMMEWWGDYVERLSSSNILPFTGGGVTYAKG